MKAVLIPLAAALVLLTLPPGAAAQGSVNVYVFAKPDPSGFVEREQKAREDSVKDITRAFDRKKVWPVSNAQDAKVSLEVLGRGYEDTGRTSSQSVAAFGSLWTDSKPQTIPTIHAVLRYLDYEKPLTCQWSGDWLSVAKRCVSQVQRWIADNRARIDSGK